MKHNNIYDFITEEETAYKTLPVNVVEGYDWSMADHIKKTILYKNSRYSTGNSDDKPYKNIIRPILNLAYRAEGFDVKDIQLFVNSAKNYFKSFLIKKFHEKWARENEIDTFIDEMVESYVDFGGALIKDINETRPEVVPWQRIAFCDQTDILSGPIAEKHFFSPDQLRKMSKKGWKNIEEVITLAEEYKKNTLGNEDKSKTPSKYIEVYEVHGVFPETWLDDEVLEYDEIKFTRQIHICTFYQSELTKNGITLYKGKEGELPYKLVLRDKIYGRALGFGGAEELFEPQVWVNYDVIRIKGMLDAASKVIYKTTDVAFANRNKTLNLDNGEILVIEEGRDIAQINTQPVNVVVFENSIREWENHARQMGAATESIMGESPSSGTPFKLQELITAESHSLHEYRKGKLATFLDEIYRDWIIPYITREISAGQEFLAELDSDELQSVSDSVVTNEANRIIKEMILKGEVIYPDQIEEYKQKVMESFLKGGNKKFIEILKGELKNDPIDVYVNIAGKQKYLAQYTDKLVNIFRQIIAAPGVLDDPRMAKIFNEIIESSGLSPIDFYSKPQQSAEPLYVYNQRRFVKNAPASGKGETIKEMPK